MKIIFVNRFFYPDHSATSQLLTDLAFHRAKVGTAVYIVTSRQVYDKPQMQLFPNELVNNVCVTRVWTTHFGRHNLIGRALDYLTFYVSTAWTLFRMVRSGDVVIAKTDPPLISVVVAVVVKLRHARLVNWLQDLFPEVAQSLGVGGIGGIHKLLQLFRNWSLRVSAMNVTIGERMAGRLQENGIQPDCIRVIHNWADGAAIQPVDHENNSLRRDWHLQNTFVVGYSGNMGRAHEFGTILDAAERLKDMPHIVFLFIGGGAQLSSVQAEVHKRGLQNFIFKPYQPREQLALSLSVPDVHLVSLQPEMEGLIVPSKFYGIAAAGRPAIYVGDPSGEIPNILRKFECGYTISIGDAEGLSKCISKMSSGDETLTMGVRARQAFDQNFDQKYAFAAWEQLLSEVTRSQVG